ncbi:MAG: transcriptional regulator [Rhodospirillales bacterium 20-60-12]|nr:MAG: transcriptional regulator [Rhodospirillales bacterium 20-60-12]
MPQRPAASSAPSSSRATKGSRNPVVSSAHLAEGGMPALSEVEFGLNLAVNAYHRWMARCMAAAGAPSLSALEILILHTVRHRDRPKRFADIMLVLDIEETHLATYAVNKLLKLNLVEIHKSGKEKLVQASASGIALCASYAEVRAQLLVAPFATSNANEEQLSSLAALLRSLSGHYGQAARAAATL